MCTATEVVQQAEELLHLAVAGAHDFALHPLLRLHGREPRSSPKGFDELWEGRLVKVGVADRAWGIVCGWRNALLFATAEAGLVWLEDKVAQRRLMADWPTDAAKPLPSEWFDKSTVDECRAKARRHVD